MAIKNNAWFMLCALFICSSLKPHFTFASPESISANQSLSGDQTIVSAGGVFELGFFKPGNSSNYYIGMWYKKLSEKTIIWVANREKPVSDKHSSLLSISNGNLVLFNESKMPIWSTSLNSTNTTSSIEAVLLDEGNLVLRDMSSNFSDPLWQSFDHLTDTWLPGMRFGRNKREADPIVTSWKNKENPAPGLFSVELASDGSDQFVSMWNGSEQYWSSGLWNGMSFANIPEMITHQYFDFQYISDEKGKYMVYSVSNSMLTRTIIDSSGQILQLFWLENSKAWFQFWSQPRQPCDVYAYCGAFGSCNEGNQSFCACQSGFRPKLENDWNLMHDYSGGCVRRTQLQCESNVASGNSDRFLANPSMVLPKHRQSVAVGSVQECERTCLSNCSCTAYAYEDKACSVWIGSLFNLQQLVPGDTNGKTIFIKLAASEFSSSSNNKGRVIGGVLGSVVLVVLLGLVGYVYVTKRKSTMKASKSLEDGSLVAFAYKDLKNATKNFSEKLGGGGFGSVFKGVLPNSSVIAVKNLQSVSQGEKQFRAEVSTIGNIQHVNLVRLRGFCSEGTKKLLVYDYFPNSSLDSHIFHGKDSKVLDWKTRYQIALGTARGLVYLHEKCRDCIIHCDIKPENILLDAEWCPKVADFGLAKLVGREFSRVLTTIRGTRGYLAPEWISGVAITAKADVYSYGMMLLEIVSGRRNSAYNCKHNEDGEMEFFPSWAASLMNEGGNVISLLDTRLQGNADIEELSRICKVACWCIQDDETQRPSMGQVVHILEGVLEVTQSPIPMSLQIVADNHNDIIFFTESSKKSAASSQDKFTGTFASS